MAVKSSDNGDYSKIEDSQAETVNLFQIGSRHPKWRGGVSKETKKNRQRNYYKYGIGFTTATNSAAANDGTDIAVNPVADFKAGRTNILLVSHVKSVDQINKLVGNILGYAGIKPILNSANDSSTFIYIERVQYKITISFADDEHKFKLERTGVVARAKRKRTLLSAVRELKRKKAKKMHSLPKSRSQPHKNVIKGLENLADKVGRGRQDTILYLPSVSMYCKRGN